MTLRLRATNTLVLATSTVVLFTTNTTPCKKKKQTNLLDLVLTRIQCNKKWKRMICLSKARKKYPASQLAECFSMRYLLYSRVLFWRQSFKGFAPKLLTAPPYPTSYAGQKKTYKQLSGKQNQLFPMEPDIKCLLFIYITHPILHLV